jgi:iron complex outermembrane receptor protein
LNLKRNLLSVALASATLMLSTGAYAQTAEPTAEEQAAKAKAEAAQQEAKTLDKVVVTGIRAGIETSIETKQTATSIVESISAEDIGKLPDSSIAESIARLPGLTAQRERGRATQINIRGFAGDFAGTTLNGREQVSTGDNRGVEFDQYPSELLSSVVVYKTPDASLVGQGLSGTVDLRTARPLAFADRVIAANYRADQNTVNDQDTYGNRYSLSYIDQFLDNTLGLAIGYAHLDSPAPGYQNEAWGYADEPGGTSNKVFGGGKLYKFDNNNERDGLMATLQFKPNDFYEGTLDLFQSQFDKTEIKTGVEFGTAWGSGVLQPGWVANGNGTITDSTWTGVKPVLRMDSNPIHDELKSYGFNNKFKLNDNWSVEADLSRSDITRNFRVLETYAGPVGGTSDLRVLLKPGAGYNEFTFGTDLNDPANLQLVDNGGWGQDGYLKDFQINDRLDAVRFDATRTFDTGFLSSAEFGLNRTERSKDKSSDESRLCIIDCVTPGASAPFPGTSGDFGFGGLDGLAVFDANTLLNSGFYNLDPKFHENIANKNWSVDETVTTYYAQANIDTDLGTLPLRGNVGFQYVAVDQNSTGFSTFSGNPAGTEISGGANYGDFLPSLNLSLGLPAEQVLRFAAARQMARPRMDDMRASYDVSNSASGCAALPGPMWCGGGGNPQLQPWLANAYDLSYEKYFTTESGSKGYVAAAYFFKDLQTYIYRQDVEFDYAGLPLPPPTPIQVPGVDYPASTVGVINQPTNGTGGFMRGLELTVSAPLDVLWKPLHGFGIQATYSDTDSSISPNGPGTSEPLPGLSKYVSNVTAYYENHGFSVRYSQRKRSAFRGETRGFGADLTYINIDAETVQDAQLNYSFGEGALEGLSLYLQVSNIGDEPFTTSDGGDPAARPVQYFEYGRTTLLGFSYKF